MLGVGSVPQVHRDEYRHTGVKFDVTTIELESVGRTGGSQRHLNRNNLLRNSRQHPLFQPIELIEASPRACLAQTRKNSAHGREIKCSVAVEDDASTAKHSSKRFDCFSLAGTSGSEGRAALLVEDGL